jgi:hypothetical protein
VLYFLPLSGIVIVALVGGLKGGGRGRPSRRTACHRVQTVNFGSVRTPAVKCSLDGERISNLPTSHSPSWPRPPFCPEPAVSEEFVQRNLKEPREVTKFRQNVCG